MKPLLCSLLAALATAGVAVPQTESSTATNLGIASFTTLVDGQTEVLLVPELQQGATDLNGDGDALDNVLHLHDAAAGTTTNLGLVPGYGAILFEKGYVVFGLDEFQHGADLNADGDVTDVVLQHYEVATGVLTNLGLAAPWAYGTDGRRIVLLVDEAQQGATDLNGDGDAVDGVVHLHDIATATTTSLGLAANQTPELAGDMVGMIVWEANQGAIDLNGDGDASDSVVHLYDHVAGTTTNVGLDASGGLYLERGYAAFLVSESQQGGTDLNGDGDAVDTVLHGYDVAAGATTNLGLSTWMMLAEAGNVVFGVHELGQATDLNGDGDLLDIVLHELVLASGTATNLGLAGLPGSWWMDGHRLAFVVDETSQGATDLNGDGDAMDLVLHTRDLVTRTTANTGLAGYGGMMACNLLATPVSESTQGGLDLNGDGDATDDVLFVLDLRLGTTTNVGLATIGQWAEGNALLFAVPEPGQGGTDLNGDGDALDWSVIHAWDPVAQAAENLGVVASIPWGDETGDRNLAGSVAFEGNDGVDLNGDGDTSDSVAFLYTLDVPYGLVGDGDRVRLSAGDPHQLSLDAGPGSAGDLYVLVGSFSGTSPGIPFGKVVLPLNWDAYMQFTFLNPNTPILSSSFALLDGQGESTARFQLPAGSDPTLAGVTLHHAYLVIDLSTFQFGFASNAFGVKLVS